MSKRSVVAVIVLTLVTCGIYGLVWQVMTKDEMVREGADIPTAWLIIVPIANLYWLWKWCGGVEHVTRGKLSQPIAFLLGFLLSIIGMAIIQDAINKAIDAEAESRLPRARIA